ncbi:uncharacterized protein EI97DRAFT_444301 [Westerdykella ornata]|uniref:Uncharacterized protein n=1 Tax=Westerdykella ornata TaxID=318751 RepID=A0A6A6JE66_WESOR|nr:uncharacterized protein EI97DRAFT_444301 [Westerdykella ornata]KAF2274298.1 hypothetical protein EI97DRAFT_444301 [Westerdykella ornata]
MVTANVEKTIFVTPQPIQHSNDLVNFENTHIEALSAAPNSAASVLHTQLPVQFPSSTAPHGRESWYLLKDLEAGRRYEVRICWPATSPTDFWLDTFSATEVRDSSKLLESLLEYSKRREAGGSERELPLPKHIPPTTLFLRIQAAASFYSTNRSLMETPPPVAADIILDPYLFNILPQSLAPTAAYISVVAVGAWYLSAFIYRSLLRIAADPAFKAHED